MADYHCDICGELTLSNGYCKWKGPPFAKRGTKELCYFCLSVIKPQVVENFAIIGSSAGDVYSLQEMISEGFDKKRMILSIKSVGQAIGLSLNDIKKKLKSIIPPQGRDL